jgi:diguanylate cyclase (GGDEF)-like protein
MQAVLATIRIFMAQIQAGRVVDLLTQRHHAPYLTRHRLEAVVARIRLVAVAFSTLTLVWIGFDVATLDLRQWLPLAAFRLVAVVAFLALAVVPDRIRTRPAVLGMLAATLALPMMLYVVAQFVIGGTHLEGLAAINGRLYEALPFIVLAGLSIFPLVVLEGLLFAVSVLALVSLVQVASVGLDPVRLFSTLWVLALALGIYLLASAIQLHYMMALLHRASYDPLTGALTRRSGAEVIDLHFRLACEQETPLAIAFLDLDNFKGINDQFGHEAGDQALRGVVEALSKSLRKADAVIRWGGEEFVIVMTNTGMEGVRIAMNRLFDEWLGGRPDGTPLTASIGVSERITDAVMDWSQLIKLADERMYEAKKSGKARGVLSDGEIIIPSR